MGSLRRALINVHRILHSDLATYRPVSLFRPQYGFVSRFCSGTSQPVDVDFSDEESKRRLFNRLLYRSKQRGFLELDLVLGKWVEDNIHSMDQNGIKALVHVLDLGETSTRDDDPESGRSFIVAELRYALAPVKAIFEVYTGTHRTDSSLAVNNENPDLWKWLTGQEQPPEAVSINPVFSAVKDKVMKNLNSYASPETRAIPGQPWVRGWDDFKKGHNAPIAGNQ